ncbi:MAG: amyA [Rhodospirillales bacterium]|nr:amyA [Rhodospirillales bacterium]
MNPDPLWYKDAIIYQLHVKAFFDANNDGIGDIAGLTSKLDYLQDLGVTTLWLLPFYPSPLRDDGYDIADYRDINPSYGSLADFRIFVREAHRRNLRVITELVVNHTSDQHPWFQRARRAKPGSRLRDFYVWSDTDQKFLGTRVIFLDTEKSNWAWDPVAQSYYWHRFYSHQPDLNFDNPRVFRSIVNVMKFWLEMGVDGMRLDAVPYLVEREGTNNENLPETHEILKRLRSEMDRAYPGRMLLAEANQWPEDVRHYFGEGDECHMAFHFPVMPRIYMAVATEDRHPITDIMRQTPEIPENCQWAVFLRNHDELTLEMVTDRERDYLWNYYASDRRMRINLGIRRRLTPLMENDRRKIELLNSVMFSMPGTPVMYYGDEIGMGDNVFLGDRDGVRTPMQWTPDRNGGFSRADPASLYLPPIMDPVYGYEAVNVEAQSRSPTSLLNWMKRLIAVRLAHRAFGRGTLKFLYPSNRRVLAYLREFEDETILCVTNLGRSPQAVELDLSAFKGRIPIELFGRSEFPRIGDLPYLLTLQGHSFFWFVLAPVDETQAAPTPTALPEFITLVLAHGWADLLDRHNRPQVEADVLPSFLVTQRWFAGKGRRLLGTSVVDRAELPRPEGKTATGDPWLFIIVEVTLEDAPRQFYLLPLAIAWEVDPNDASLSPCKLADARRFRRNGTIFDAAGQADLALAIVDGISREKVIEAEHGQIVFSQTGAFANATLPEEPVVRRLGLEQSNSSILIEDYAVFKFYRRLQEGIAPEVEMARFLTEVGFPNTPPLLGAVEFVREGVEGASTTVGVLTTFVRNQGEAWTQALDYIGRFLEDSVLGSADTSTPQGRTPGAEHNLFFFVLARQLGRRTAQMHRALCPDPAQGSVDPAFAPEPTTAEDLASWREAAHAGAVRALAALERAGSQLPEGGRELAVRLLDQRHALTRTIDALIPASVTAAKTRFHGDYHLGQVLVVQNDFTIIDFEGEPLRSVEERRAKSSPLRDVAGMLRSFDYAAASGLRQMADIPPSLRPTAERCAGQWRVTAADAFMTGYLAEMAGCPSLPAEPEEARRLIDFFTLEKALYEVEYELANRPGWVTIPLTGVLEIIAANTPKPIGDEEPTAHGGDSE